MQHIAILVACHLLQGILQQAAVGSPGSAPGTPTAGGASQQQQQPDVRLVLPLMERVTTIFRQATEQHQRNGG